MGNIVPRDFYQSIGQTIPLLIIGCLLWWEYVPEQAKEEKSPRAIGRSESLIRVPLSLDYLF